MTDGLLGPADVRRIAATIGLRPTKTLGQNFVVDANTVRRIVAGAGLAPEDPVLEVGPGLGSLTLGLLDRVSEVVAIEVDPLLARQLPLTVAERRPDRADRLRVLAGDALSADARSLVTGSGSPPLALVANLPYNVAVPVLLRLLAALPSLRRALVMVQAEVADRLAAGPGSRTYGAPSVKAAWWGQVRRAGPVPRSVFWPVPGVDSGLVSIERTAPPVTTATRAQVFAVVDAAFAQRRKTLRRSLAPWAGSADSAEQAVRQAGIDPSARGEQLDVAQFARIAAVRSRP